MSARNKIAPPGGSAIDGWSMGTVNFAEAVAFREQGNVAMAVSW